MSELVQIIEHGAVRELRLARAPVNALDDALCAALLDALQAAFDANVAGIALSGNARVFSGGLDVPYLLGHGADRDALYASWDAFFAVAKALASAPMPVAAALTGHAPAGGCVLALCCDYRVMTRSADPSRPLQIGLNETQVGLAVPDGIQHLMRRVIGKHRAERLLVAGAMISAEHAAEIGLVDALADDADATVTTALAWLQAMATLPQAPLRKTRTIARADIRAALDRVDLNDFIDDWQQPDTQAALQAMAARLRK
ncbi:Enoyl-CoA hydratase/carnithine racemase [Pseudoxanthomonas sp. GM95]|uniref:enoyl-CoA hydratase/isomerase family protein n=1 Tax=Pseudoxanthomonas sp. GM95 TaxID=1881043 RepID=UPI0008B935BA|nr:enoyl-CoA hydratase/isomerase family protein [Pseudoxanthomonas sp. GM95]SEL82416.1 Enoyl-CoA hydratase/carnithine racemase [Pseudoxanthomonas sp. GM95]